MPGGPFKDPKYMKVPYGHQCDGLGENTIGNLGQCLTWRECFKKCLDKSIKAGADKPDDQCSFVHFETASGRCSSVTEKQCEKSTPFLPNHPNDGMIVMQAYFYDSMNMRKAQAIWG